MFALDGAVRGRARELLGAFKDKGRCDFVKEFAIPFPVSIFLDLFGLPPAEVEQFLTWETALLHSPNMQERIKATPEVKAYLLDAMGQRRKKPREARTRAVSGKSVSVRVGVVGRRIMQEKTTTQSAEL